MHYSFSKAQSDAINSITVNPDYTVTIAFHSNPAMGYVYGVMDDDKLMADLSEMADGNVSVGSTYHHWKRTATIVPMADPADLRQQLSVTV